MEKVYNEIADYMEKTREQIKAMPNYYGQTPLYEEDEMLVQLLKGDKKCQ